MDFRGTIMGSLKSPCATSYRSSIDTIALNCLVFEKIAFLRFDDRQTDKQTNRWTSSMREAAVSLSRAAASQSRYSASLGGVILIIINVLE